MALARAGRLARPTPPRASGAALCGPHGAVYFPSGTKGQQTLAFPALTGLRGRAAAPANVCDRALMCAGLPHGTPFKGVLKNAKHR